MARTSADSLRAEGLTELARLHVIRGSTPKRTERRRRRAEALLLTAATLAMLPVQHASADTAVVPRFLFPGPRHFGLTQVEYSASPNMVDLDGDGDLDALVGDGDGSINFFRNTGTSAVPAFAPPSVKPFGLTRTTYLSAPDFADIDGDGDLDVLVGEIFGHLSFFRNTGSAAAPAFGPRTRDPFGLRDVGDVTEPDLADIDGDGDLDAFIGDSSGDTFFFRNVGTSSRPAFTSPSRNPFGLRDVEDFASPELADIDGDGDLDALINGMYDISFFRNTGNASSPAFAPPVTDPFGLTHFGQGSRATDLADVDADGDLDLFWGDVDGLTHFFRNTGTAFSPAFAAELPGDLVEFGDVGFHSSIEFGDIDADGDADAFVDDGTQFLLFRNTGTASAPAFDPPTTDPFGPIASSTREPILVDIDADGDLDAFLGDFEGRTVFLRNTGSAFAPAFAAPSINPFGLTDVGNNSSHDLADVDGDGDLDAFIGSRDGRTVFFRNTGTTALPAFASPSTNPFGLSDVGEFNSPNLGDVDGDGDLDVFMGRSRAETMFFRNDGSATSPEFAAPTRDPFGLRYTFGDNKPELVDIDGDGDLDLFVADSTGMILFYENAPIGEAGFVIEGVTGTEGTGGTTAFDLTITRVGDSSRPASVQVKAANGTAKATKDFKQIPKEKRTIRFAAGETTRSVTVKVFGDAKPEMDETFVVRLSKVAGAVILDGTGIGTITNDD